MKRIVNIIGCTLFSICSISYGMSYLGLNAQKNFAHWLFKTPNGDDHFNVEGVNTGIFGGYGCILDPNFYLGGEIFASLIPLHTSKETIDDTVYQAKAKYGLGLRFIAGHYIFPATFIFVSIGVIDTEFEFEATDTTGLKNDENSNVFAVQYGLGIQSKIYQKLDGRLEYIYSNYQSFNSLGNKIFPQNNQINLGIIYRIN